MGILLRSGIHFLQDSVQFAETLSEMWDEEKLVCDTLGLAEQRCVSLLRIRKERIQPAGGNSKQF